MAGWRKVVVETTTANTISQDTTGNAGTASALETARTIGGVSFNGTANINLPGVNTAGNQDTSGNAATATALETARTIALSGDVSATGVSFDGSANITISGTNIASNVVGANELNVTGNGTSGQYLTSDGDGSFSWSTPAAGTLSGLSDTDISSPASGHILIYDGTDSFDNYAISGDISLGPTGAVTVNSVQANSVTLGTSTTGNYVATISGTANEIEVSGSGSETAAVTIGLPSNVTIGNNLTVSGDLTVNGTTTTINSTTISVDDKQIELAATAAPDESTANGGGILIHTGDATQDPVIAWNSTEKLGGFEIYKQGTATAAGWISLMTFGTGAPSGTPTAGDGTLYCDSGDNFYIYFA